MTLNDLSVFPQFVFGKGNLLRFEHGYSAKFHAKLDKLLPHIQYIISIHNCSIMDYIH
jgi:hypothetical protein